MGSVWNIADCRGRTIHPTSAELDFLEQTPLQSAPRCLTGKSERWREPVCGRIPERGSWIGLAPGSAPQTSGDPAPAHLPPSATAVGGQSCRQSGQRQQQCSRNPAGQQRPVPHGLPGLARSVLQLGRLWLLPATVGRDAAVAAVVRVRSLALTALGAGGGQHGSRSQLVG